MTGDMQLAGTFEYKAKATLTLGWDTMYNFVTLATLKQYSAQKLLYTKKWFIIYAT